MTEVLRSPPSHHFPYPSSSSSTPCAPNNYNNNSSSSNNGGLGSSLCIADIVQEREQEDQERELDLEQEERERGEGDRLSLLTLLVAAFRKSLVGCSIGKELCSMEIGLPINVRHVAHVTFDRFNGFLGLPVEFESEVPRRAPSASATVFGVSTKSMQLSFDSRGNSVPTILLLMQRHLYAQEGLRAEGIFRINAENAQEEYVRDQLNRGVVPEDIDVHCLAGLIKAWFRELPTGVLDSLSPEQVMQSQSEEECTRLVRLLPPSEAALLDWAINLMADVSQFEHFNKMNARNVAMVFAPNMTHMSDPLTALMYAVQVMNFLKTLIIKTLKEREDSMVESISFSCLEPSDESGHPSSSDLYPVETEDQANEGNEEEKAFVTAYPVLESPSHPNSMNESIPVSHLDPSDWSEHKSSSDLYPVEIDDEANEGNEEEKAFITADLALESAPHSPHHNSRTETSSHNFLTSIENIIPSGTRSLSNSFHCDVISHVNSLTNGLQEGGFTGSSRRVQTNISKIKTGLKGPKKLNEQSMALAAGPVEKSNGDGIVGRVNSRPELFEALRRRSTI